MLSVLKRAVKGLLTYEPLPETEAVRNAIEASRKAGQPFCPSSEGDLIFSLITENGFKSCLELGFYTGSTALYIAAAIAPRDGRLISICIDDEEIIERGKDLLRSQGYEGLHKVICKNSNIVVPELYVADERFDFVFVDGWKTFDHLVSELYMINHMLEHGGVIAFDDSHMPSVRKAIKFLQSYYGYEEIDYARHNQSCQLRLFQCLTGRSLHRPYRAFKKVVKTEDQRPFHDLNFHREI